MTRDRRQPRPPLTMWTVEIRAHRVERWIVAQQVAKLPAPTAASARLFALRRAHQALNMPPWRPLLRASWPYPSAERMGEVSRRRESLSHSQAQASILDQVAA